MTVREFNYPWYSIVEGDDLEQGDILESCPVFVPPSDLRPEVAGEAQFKWIAQNLVILSQSCDLVKGTQKLEEVLFCPLYTQIELEWNEAKIEEARKGRFPGYHLIAPSEEPDFERDVRVVEFRRVYTLPLDFVRTRAADSKRLRLMPPYREHLSQAFARFFMRVGLPVDIPPAKRKAKAD